MGHSINAVVIAGSIDEVRAQEFDVKTVPCHEGFTLIALSPYYIDFWAEKLDIHGSVAAQPLGNFQVVHHIVNFIADSPKFALIMTDYFGGVGEQSAAAYEGDREIMAPSTDASSVINRALGLVGVKRGLLADEFTTLGLPKYRTFDDLFEDY